MTYDNSYHCRYTHDHIVLLRSLLACLFVFTTRVRVSVCVCWPMAYKDYVYVTNLRTFTYVCMRVCACTA